jgi:uncharacterized peroxidase-related enzyme
MPRIAPLGSTQANPATAATLEAVRAKFGKVPNLIGTLAHSPTALHGYLAFSAPEAQGHLDPRQREVIALAVGQANRCGYCLSAHSYIGASLGLEPDAIAAARGARGGDGKEAALARFARHVVEARGWVEDAEFEALKSAGFGPEVAVEIVALVALNTLTNYANHLAGTEIDFPEVAVDAPARAA